MFILPTTLSLITTHHCTAACEHCCFACNPKVTKRIPKENLKSLIDEAALIPTLKLICFTGGECFTLGKELEERVFQAHSLGFRTRCITNGYWAYSEAAAEKKLTDLKNCGLSEINFSTGNFHQKYVKIERILNGVKAAVRNDILTVVNIEICNESFELNNNIFFADPDIKNFIENKKLIIQRNVWIKSDGVKEISHPSSRSRFLEQNKTRCNTVLNVLTVTPDLDLSSCCGLHLEKIGEMKIGNLRNKSLIDILKTTPDDLIKMWIHTDGPEAVLEASRKINPNIDLPLSSTHPCETCLFLYSNKESKKVLAQAALENENYIMDRFLEILSYKIFESEINENIAKNYNNNQYQ
ncbi:radical SAM protein [Fluviispira sanaruensis]|uniref:Radical SAM core domain-containing protein n=1 Tax=Fluviispira sanaruensis TaxID=2493639 RepID=A0A4P2VK62_FLUSA|nr:radical SAM protein [Fluviispira sanaruensis]BBH52030.1 hypothetical protein JCM31447_04670 [Fluviispira sanaruensis]